MSRAGTLSSLRAFCLHVAHFSASEASPLFSELDPVLLGEFPQPNWVGGLRGSGARSRGRVIFLLRSSVQLESFAPLQVDTSGEMVVVVHGGWQLLYSHDALCQATG